MPIFLVEIGKKGAEIQATNATYACGLCFEAQNPEDTLSFLLVPAIIILDSSNMQLMLRRNVDSVNSGGELLGSRRKGCRTVLYF